MLEVIIKRQILIVDDDISILELMDGHFTASGYEVFRASSAEEARETLKENPVDLLFLDIQLPGMNGMDFAREVTDQNPVAICFAMTGYATVFHFKECRAAGFEDYYVKPFNIKLMVKSADSALTKIERWRDESRGAL